jgi:hypothetical protein
MVQFLGRRSLLASPSAPQGVFLTLFFTTAYFMIYKPIHGRIQVANLIYIAVLFLVTTVNVVTGMRWNQMIWIDDRNYVRVNTIHSLAVLMYHSPAARSHLSAMSSLTG